MSSKQTIAAPGVVSHNPLDALAVAVAEASYSRESSQGSGEVMSTVAPEIPESLIVATKIKRGRPKRSEQEYLSEDKQAAANEGYRQIVNKIAQDASEDNGGRRRQFVCTVSECGKVFYQRAHLNIHIRSHTGYKPYACRHPGCGKSFPQLGNMKTHERIHTGDRPFQCHYPDCSKAFTQMGNLKTHLKKIHNLETPTKARRRSQMLSLSPLSSPGNDVGARTALDSGNVSSDGKDSVPLVNIINGRALVTAATLAQLQLHQHEPQQSRKQHKHQHSHQGHYLPPLAAHTIIPATILANAKLAGHSHV